MSDEEKPDDREPTPERQAELRAAYEANMAAGKAPYAGVRILTQGELHWVMQERGWSGEVFLPEDYERANLSGAAFNDADLNGATLAGANLSGATLLDATLSGANLHSATVSGANLRRANLSGAHLNDADLSRAYLRRANLSGANLRSANLSGAALFGATLSGAALARATLSGADLRSSRMDATADLRDAHLDTYTKLSDVVWNGVNLTRLNWQDVAVLGEEQVAHDPRDANGKRKDQATRLREYADAVLANRQVATELRSQGLNEHADRFAYRAQLCQRRLLRLQRHYLRYLGSLFLGLIAGYGYRPLRSFIAYAVVILGFMGLYLLNSHFVAPHLTWNEALVLSMSSFHGRGFFNPSISLGDTYAQLAAAEAFIGLMIEITFIATFTQRFFAR